MLPLRYVADGSEYLILVYDLRRVEEKERASRGPLQRRRYEHNFPSSSNFRSLLDNAVISQGTIAFPGPSNIQCAFLHCGLCSDPTAEIWAAATPRSVLIAARETRRRAESHGCSWLCGCHQSRLVVGRRS